MGKLFLLIVIIMGRLAIFVIILITEAVNLEVLLVVLTLMQHFQIVPTAELLLVKQELIPMVEALLETFKTAPSPLSTLITVAMSQPNIVAELWDVLQAFSMSITLIIQELFLEM